MEKRDKALREQEYLEAFLTRQKELDRYIESISSLMLILRVLRSMEIIQPNQPNEGEYVIQLIKEAKHRFSMNPEWIVESNVLDKLKRNLDSFNPKLKKFIENEWKHFCQSHLPVLNKEVLQVLAKIPSYSNDIALINKLYQEMVHQMDSLPRKVSDIKLFLEKGERISEIWKQIGSGDLPNDVLCFLRHASSKQGASLRLLTPEVSQWLESHHLFHSFIICVKQ